MPQELSKAEVLHVAKLANLPLTKEQEVEFGQQLGSILDLVSQLQKVKTKNIVPTDQVTGLNNVFRDDRVDPERMFSQEQALANVKRKHQGFFVVPPIFE
jgi:aspartyl-tRNA(Asn)/glutamyl-tRNA(Gln) amidotransferase subunit C